MRDVAGRQRFATQLPDRGRLWLTRAPLGVRARASAWTGRAYAGPFRDLRASGLARGARLDRPDEPSLHAGLRPDELDAVADRGARAGDGRRAVPELGRGRPRDGRPARRRHAPGGLGRAWGFGRVAHLLVESEHGAYVVVPTQRPRGATVHLVRTKRQSSAPLAGPALAVQLVRRGRARTARFGARYAPVERERAAETAARMAR